METTPPSPQTSPSNTPQQGDLLAAIAYFPFLFLVTGFAKGSEEKYMWHAKRGAAFTVIWALTWFIVSYAIVPLTGLDFLSYLVDLILLLLFVFLALKAWKGNKMTLPLIETLALKIPLENIFSKKVTSAAAQASAPVQMPEVTTAAPVQEPSPVVTPVSEPMPTVSTPTPAEPAPVMPTPSAMPAPEIPEVPQTPTNPQNNQQQ